MRIPKPIAVLMVATLVLLGLVACDDDEPAATDGGTDVEFEVVDDAADAVEEGDTTAPVISDVTVTENPAIELTAWVEFETDEPAYVSLLVSNGDDHEFLLGPSDTAGADHTITVLGMRWDNTYTLTITAADAAGNESADDSETFTTGAPPDDLPPFDVTSTPEEMSPGVTLFSLFRNVGGAMEFNHGWYYALDAEGEVVWYTTFDSSVWDVRMLDNGHLLLLAGPGLQQRVVELDMMGEIVEEWRPDDLDPPADTFHHEIFPMPNGNFLTVGTELRNISGYPDPENEGATVAYDVTGDPVIEFDRDGTVVNFWSSFDLLADYHTRIGNPQIFNLGSRNAIYPEAAEGTKIWAGTNAVIYDEDEDLVIVSYRGHSWVVAFSRETNEVLWKLGCEGDFELSGGTGEEGECDPEWHFAQHAPEIQDDGSILLYDNGNNRPGTGLGGGLDEPYSRAVIYSLDTSDADPSNWTARVEWEYVNDSEPQYCSFTGDADRLDNGNVLITEGGLRRSDSSPPGPGNPVMARITEVTTDDPPEEVFELVIHDTTPAPENEGDPIPVGYIVYRAERLPSLYGPASAE